MINILLVIKTLYRFYFKKIISKIIRYLNIGYGTSDLYINTKSHIPYSNIQRFY
jgi:hypothetical protein